MAGKLNTVFIPTHYCKVEVPSDDEGKRKLLQGLDKEMVLLNDEHSCMSQDYILARIRIDEKDNQCFYAQQFDQAGNVREKRMWYNDLNGLMISEAMTAIRHDF